MASRLIRLSHITFQVSNARKVTRDLAAKYQFHPFAARGLDGGSPYQVALRNGGVVFMVNENSRKNPPNSSLLYDFALPLPTPDTACNVSFEVEDVPGFCQWLIGNGCRVLVPPKELHDDYGSVTFCVIKSVLGNVQHTLIDRTRYRDGFLPGFQTLDVVNDLAAHSNMTHVDHVTYACPRGTTPHVIKWYERCFGYKHFPLRQWEDPEKGFEISGPRMGLRLTTIECPGLREGGKLVLGESLPQEGINQVDQFLQHHEKGGIQHVGLFTPDIFKAASSMAQQGVCFASQPSSYYSDPTKQEEMRGVGLEPDLLLKFGILLDFAAEDAESVTTPSKKFLLQVFAEPLFSKDSVYLELIERRGAEGFGEGNIRALWRSLQDLMESSNPTEQEEKSSAGV
ncbi:4-hydroxyphenylpyruvate dioxygenase-like protein [Spea bombifrons]|uniref:4-hydroxyphenylpyruvate dioxygenase-like protein n=1 Tax=Spea bombifrons TaxID=233779 RepID=UPI002348FEC7|nr:4-hydroxyphenylpyruvate dioxygenase-like protein [Spea bombifrons]